MAFNKESFKRTISNADREYSLRTPVSQIILNKFRETVWSNDFDDKFQKALEINYKCNHELCFYFGIFGFDDEGSCSYRVQLYVSTTNYLFDYEFSDNYVAYNEYIDPKSKIDEKNKEREEIRKSLLLCWLTLNKKLHTFGLIPDKQINFDNYDFSCFGHDYMYKINLFIKDE